MVYKIAMESGGHVWYEQGSWPLVGAIVVLLLTNGVAIWQIFAQARQNLKFNLRMKRIDQIYDQLSGFYDPIYSMMMSNKSVFDNFGPDTFPGEQEKFEVAVENWQMLKYRVIIPNNKEMINVIRSKSYLLGESDDIENYMDLSNHMQMYEIFSESPTEAYSRFQFPKNILQHIEAKRKELVSELSNLRSTK